MSSPNPETTTKTTTADVDPEMLKNLNLLINYDSLDSEDLWDDFIKNFSELDQAAQEQTEKELENENQ